MKIRLLAALLSGICVLSHGADETAPAIAQVQPTPGTVTSLTNITVRFSERIAGISVFDFLVNGQVAESMTGAEDTWVFQFQQPTHGTVVINWDSNHTIADDAGNRFNHNAAGATWQYNFVDTISPLVELLTPAAGATVRQLSQIEVQFNEAVTGVDAADLLINGAPAASISILGQGRYLFSFPAPPQGSVQAAWAGNHQIRDFASPGNAFGGGSWSYTLDPAAGVPDVRINEFLAANATGLRDENLEYQDWIEIHNRGATAVDLGGWSLTDDPDNPGQWIFPSTNLAAGQYLVVFASGKDRRAPTGANRLHTNFKLNPSEEYLGLFNGESPRVVMTEFAPDYPEQRNDHSYGYDSTGALKYFSTPTPGAANGASQISDIVPPPHFNVQRGMFEAPFTLHLSCDLPGATIRFTTDGSEPTASTGAVYSGPMEIADTTVIRAIATKPDMLPSATVTHTYLFLEQVVRQSSNPAGFPTNWGFGGNIPDVGQTVFSPGSTIPGLVPADYEMDMDPLRVEPNNTNSPIDAAKLQRLKDGLLELPTISIVTTVEDMFGTTGLHQRSADETGRPGNKPQNEKPCSVEMILPDGTTAFATTCSIDLHGNASRNPVKNPKHGFKLTFKGDYGPPTLDYRLFEDSPVEEYDDVLLRPDFNSSWRHWSDTAGQGLGAFQRTRATRTRDAWMKSAMREMGGLTSHSRFCHLYLNGLYWGTFDLSEDPTEVFAKNNLGGAEEDFDVIDQGYVKNGTDTAYIAMTNMVWATNLTIYQQYQQVLNIPSYADYMLLHFFIGHQDWATGGNNGTKNWSALRKRVPGPEGTFRFIPWDGECILLNDNVNKTTAPGSDYPGGLHGDLSFSPEYRLLFADRVHRHMIAPDGALTRYANIARWQKWQAVLDKPIVAESVRWGDYRRDVHNSSEGVYQLYTREEFWLPENARMLTYFTNRPNNVLTQLRAANLYPALSAPVFSQHGGRVARNFNLSMTATNPIYYTLDGGDPREFGTSAIAAGASGYTGGITLSNSIIVKARALLNGTNWSALAEATFQVAELGPTIRVTEIMYNPSGGDAFEYLVLKNIGAAPLDISSHSFDGINYVFPPNTVIAPGALIVLAADNNPAAWATRYPSLTVFGFFDGSLSNGGEKISIKDPNNNIVYSLDYDDENGWDTAADGGGPSLKIADALADPDDPANWSATAPISDLVVLNELLADSATSSDWVELHNTGSQAASLAGWSITDDSDARKFVFPAGTSIAAGGYLVVWCDSPTNTAPGPHTGFALGRRGETVSLFNASTTRVDVITFGLQIADKSVGRILGDWTLNVPTPGSANVANALVSSSNLAVNEWLANAAPGGDDWIELHNRASSAPVSLKGIFIGNGETVHQINSLSFIDTQGFVQLFATELAGADHLDFKLSAGGGSIVLYDESAVEIERVDYGLQTESLTQGRLPDGGVSIVNFPGSASPGTNNYAINYTGPTLNEVAAGLGWVELHNPNGAPFDLTGMALSTDLGQPPVYFESGTTVPGNGYLIVTLGELLSTESGEVHVLNSGGQVVDSVVFGFQVDELSIGRSGGEWLLLDSPTPGLANGDPAVLGSEMSLRLNEWMANPVDGDDWFEIYNGDVQPVALAGLHISDNPSLAGRLQFQFHPLSFIGAKGFVRVIADSDPSDGRNHANFSLSTEGDSLVLVGNSLEDRVFFGSQEPGVSEGRVPDGGEGITTFPETPTPRASNYLPLPNARLNEVLAQPSGSDEQAIEIYNPSSLGIDIGGWYISNHPRDHKRFRIPDGTFLPAGGYLVYQASQLGFVIQGDLSLSEADSAGNLSGRRSMANFGHAPSGKSFGTIERCAGMDFVELSSPTLGGFNLRPRIGPVMISEVMYHPPTLNSNENNIDEYIELYNHSASPVVLDEWELRDAVSYSFPTGVAIPGFGFVVVVSFDPVLDLPQQIVFRSKYGVPEETLVVGPWRGNLGNGGETIELYQSSGTLGERVAYDDVAPWPASGDGDGNSLQRATEEYLQAIHYGNDPINWHADAPSAGGTNSVSPGQPATIIAQPISRAVPTGTRVEFNVAVCGTMPFGYQWQWDGGFPANPFGPALVIESATAANAGMYRVVVSNAFGLLTMSDWATLTIQSPPVITQQPEPILTPSGTNASFTVAGSGTGPLTYQWRKNGIELPGETNATLELFDVRVPDSGDYSALVANAAGAVASVVANLEVFQRVRVLTHPQSRAVATNTSVSFTVSGEGTGALRYQWRYMGEDMAGETNSTLMLSGVQLDNSGDYTALVYDNRSAEESLPATLTILVRPFVTHHPAGLTVAVGSNVTIQAGVMGGWPLTNRWRFGVANIGTNYLTAKDTNAFFTILDIQTNQAGRYQLGLINQAGSSQLSSNAYITVVVPPTNTTALSRTDAQLSVRAFGLPRALYQWQAGEADIPGATNAVLTLTNVQMSQSGSYSVVVSVITNAAIAPATFSADLTVEPGPPVLSDPLSLSAAEFQFRLTGDSNQTYAVQFSGDLTNWTTFTNVPYTIAPVTITDPAAGTASRRFYRAYKP